MSKNPFSQGVTRIDRPASSQHGFFSRIQHEGKIYRGFFSDKKWGGKPLALAAAQEFHRQLAARLGVPVHKSRRWLAENSQHPGKSGIIGVHRVVNRQSERPSSHWMAVWSPKPNTVVKKSFSIKKFGEEEARQMAIEARLAGLRDMKD
jgi:AP2 domain